MRSCQHLLKSVSGFSVAPSVASLFQHGRLSNHFLENYLHKSPGGRRILTKAGFLRAQKAFLCSEDFSQAAFQQEDSTYELSWKFVGSCCCIYRASFNLGPRMCLLTCMVMSRGLLFPNYEMRVTARNMVEQQVCGLKA